MSDTLRSELAPHGALRVGVNLSNFLLVTGHTDDGEPVGVSPDIGRELANRLQVPVSYVTFPNPGAVADAATDDAWDIANIGAEPARAEFIDFSDPYCEIEATYLVPAGSTLHSASDVDAPGKRVAVYARAAYGCWLLDNAQHAELVKADNMQQALDYFVEQQLDAVAGLRPGLIKELDALPGARLLDDKFAAVRQAIGCRRGLEQAPDFIQRFVEDVIASGFVAEAIERHGVQGRLSVASGTG